MVSPAPTGRVFKLLFMTGTDLVFMPDGIDLRTWMATQFMAALMPDQNLSFEASAKQAVQACDKLIAELNKPQEGQP